MLSAIERVAIGTARTAGISDDKLPEVIVSEFSFPPTFNDKALAQRLKAVIKRDMGEDALVPPNETGMGAEDFGFFTADPYIPSVYFSVGGTPPADFERAKAGGPPVPSHHSPQFRISPEPSVKSGVEATVHALLDLMPGKVGALACLPSFKGFLAACICRIVTRRGSLTPWQGDATTR